MQASAVEQLGAMSQGTTGRVWGLCGCAEGLAAGSCLARDCVTSQSDRLVLCTCMLPAEYFQPRHDCTHPLSRPEVHQHPTKRYYPCGQPAPNQLRPPRAQQPVTTAGTLAAHWQAAAMLSQGPPFRCRELIQAGITSALQRAQREVQGLAHQRAGGSAAGGMHPGVVCVTGSLHAVAAAARELEPLIGGAV